ELRRLGRLAELGHERVVGIAQLYDRRLTFGTLVDVRADTVERFGVEFSQHIGGDLGWFGAGVGHGWQLRETEVPRRWNLYPSRTNGSAGNCGLRLRA